LERTFPGWSQRLTRSVTGHLRDLTQMTGCWPKTSTAEVSSWPFSRKVSLCEKRPARTPPSTFLFLPIHFSNNPEPCGSVVPQLRPRWPESMVQSEGAEARTFDAGTRTWPRAWPDVRSPCEQWGASRTRHRARRQRAEERVYRLWQRFLSTFPQRKTGARNTVLRGFFAVARWRRKRHCTGVLQPRVNTQPRHLSAVCAALRPHSSAVLW